ncbi:MAG: hypothetical protein IT308_08160 [Anaerolineaceae bacterium]|nr:hypothetical protein [Anaerolineaceae bacterium]
MKAIKIAIPFLLLGLILTVLPGAALAQAEDPLYFEETGHTVQGEFLRFYQSASDPLLLFGYPITDEIVDPTNMQTSQYFQRVRLDLVNSPSGIQVKLAPLGEILHKAGTPEVPISKNSPVCRLFSTGHTVCYAFLQFYDRFNGEVFFGKPISEVEQEGNRYVQYFEFVRMEWRPELPQGQRVALADLGKVYYDYRIGLQEFTRPDPAIINHSIQDIVVRAFVNRALAAANAPQDLYIIAQDQYLQPVEGASVNIAVLLPNGRQELYRAPLTDRDGISHLTFQVNDLPVREIVQVNVIVEYQGQTSNTSTWFRIWW